jgi:hypothetical protein
MLTRRRLLILGTGAAAALFSLFILRHLESGGGEVACGEPPVSYGRDECPVCKMIVDYGPSSAAMYVEELGRRRWYFFDDLGCAAVWYKVVKGRGGRVLAVCARDRVDGQWIDLRSAAVLITDEFTSMNTGFLAAKPENVEAYRRGEVRWGPRPGKLIKTVSGACLVERFRYGESWSVPSGWDEGC